MIGHVLNQGGSWAPDQMTALVESSSQLIARSDDGHVLSPADGVRVYVCVDLDHIRWLGKCWAKQAAEYIPADW